MSAAAPALRVLLVEDSKLISERLLELLVDIPRVDVVGTVGSEADALMAIHHSAPDVLVLDLHLGHGTGFGVLKGIRMMEKSPTVVILTNYALPQYRAQAKSLGAQYFLDKAREFELLPEIIEDIAAKSSL